MIKMHIFDQYINIEFYFKKDKEYKNITLKLLEFLNYIKPMKSYFGKFYGEIEDYRDKSEEYNITKLNNVLKNDLKVYEEYLINIYGSRSEEFSLYISPYLKEVSLVRIRINKGIFEKNKSQILYKCDEIMKYSSVMYASADAAVGNPYSQKGYGQVKFGAHWLTWYGEWALQYFKDKHIDEVKENSYEILEKETFIRSQLYVSPWKYKSKEFHKTYRNFMRKVKIEDIVLEYNKKREFHEIT